MKRYILDENTNIKKVTSSHTHTTLGFFSMKVHLQNTVQEGTLTLLRFSRNEITAVVGGVKKETTEMIRGRSVSVRETCNGHTPLLTSFFCVVKGVLGNDMRDTGSKSRGRVVPLGPTQSHDLSIHCSKTTSIL